MKLYHIISNITFGGEQFIGIEGSFADMARAKAKFNNLVADYRQEAIKRGWTNETLQCTDIECEYSVWKSSDYQQNHMTIQIYDNDMEV